MLGFEEIKRCFDHRFVVLVAHAQEDRALLVFLGATDIVHLLVLLRLHSPVDFELQLFVGDVRFNFGLELFAQCGDRPAPRLVLRHNQPDCFTSNLELLVVVLDVVAVLDALAVVVGVDHLMDQRLKHAVDCPVPEALSGDRNLIGDFSVFSRPLTRPEPPESVLATSGLDRQVRHRQVAVEQLLVEVVECNRERLNRSHVLI